MPDDIPILSTTALERALRRMAHEIAERNESGSDLVLVGVQRGGVFLAGRLGRHLQEILGQAVPIGSLDVSMHRDDIGTQAAPTVHPTVIPFVESLVQYEETKGSAAVYVRFRRRAVATLAAADLSLSADGDLAGATRDFAAERLGRR